VPPFVHQAFHGGDHPIVLFLGLNGLDDNAIRQPGVLLWSTVRVAFMISTLLSHIPMRHDARMSSTFGRS